MLQAMVRASICALALVVAACGDDGPPIDVDGGPTEPPWWTPEPGEAKNWDVQLHEPVVITEARAMYDLDLFAVVPAETTITYDDNSTVTVPAGAHPTAIADLHGRGVIVVCHVDTGAIRLTDPDASKFPGFIDATTPPPDRPDAPAAGSVIGWNTFNTANEPDQRYLDISSSARAMWSKLIFKRYDLAKQIGCDAIEADHADTEESDENQLPLSGFTVTHDDQIGFMTEIANKAHALELSVGMKNGYTVSGEVTLAEKFDWIMMENLAKDAFFDPLRAFSNKQKATFMLEYMSQVTIDTACAQLTHATFAIDGLLKDDALSSTFRKQLPTDCP
jgi:hypothetical protein